MVRKIVKMPEPAPKADKKLDGNGQSPAAVSKRTAMAEIILFPNGGSEIPFVPGLSTHPDTERRWLRLADDALDGKSRRKKA